MFGLIFFHGKSYALICQKNGLGNILGDFFTNSSGHPDLGGKKTSALAHPNDK
jgi:hypothetical protein